MIRGIVIIEDTETGERTEQWYDFTKADIESGLLSPYHVVNMKLKAMVDTVTKAKFNK